MKYLKNTLFVLLAVSPIACWADLPFGGTGGSEIYPERNHMVYVYVWTAACIFVVILEAISLQYFSKIKFFHALVISLVINLISYLASFFIEISYADLKGWGIAYVLTILIEGIVLVPVIVFTINKPNKWIPIYTGFIIGNSGGYICLIGISYFSL